MKSALLSVLFLFSSNIYAQKASTIEIMHEALESMVKLMPYMSDELKFIAPQNEKEILDNLQKMSIAFAGADHNKDLKKSNFTPSYVVMKENIDETLMLFKNKDKPFARLRLNATTGLCLSCHTQLPKDRLTGYIINHDKLNKKSFSNQFEYGNFLYVLRKYSEAITAYEQAIKDRLHKLKDIKKVDTLLGEETNYFDKIMHDAFKNSISIFTKVERNPLKAKEFIDKFITHENLPKQIKSHLNDWKTQLEKWNDVNALKTTPNNDDELLAFFNKYGKVIEANSQNLGTGKNDIDLLIVSGIVSNYLTDHPGNALTPRLLYWLGLADLQLNHNFFYTLGEFYLVECIEQFPRDAYAKKCYKAYKNEIELKFSGTMGTDIPKNKKDELKRLKKLIL